MKAWTSKRWGCTAGLAMSVVLVVGACSSPTEQAASSTTNAAASSATPSGAAPSASGGNTPTTPVPPPATDDQVAVLASSLSSGASPEVAACVQGRLNADRELAGAAATGPESPRWPEAAAISADCVNDVVFAARFATSVSSAVPGGAGAEQTKCLQDAFAALPSTDVSGLMSAGLEPSKADAGLGERINQLVAGCGIDPKALRPPTDPASDGR